MTVLSQVQRARIGAEWREARRQLLRILAGALFTVGWAAAKACRVVLTTAAGLLFGLGWVAGRVLTWSAAAVRLGWQSGRKPMGGPRGSS